MEAELSYRLRNGISFYVTGSNLTDEPQLSYTGYESFVEDASFSGRKFTFGAEYEF